MDSVTKNSTSNKDVQAALTILSQEYQDVFSKLLTKVCEVNELIEREVLDKAKSKVVDYVQKAEYTKTIDEIDKLNKLTELNKSVEHLKDVIVDLTNKEMAKNPPAPYIG